VQKLAEKDVVDGWSMCVVSHRVLFQCRLGKRWKWLCI